MKILLIEEENDVIYMIKRVLSREGYQVLSHKEYDSCVLSRKELGPDLFLVGEIYHGMDGCDVCSTIKELEKGGNIPVIPILYDEPGLEERMKRCEHKCDGFIVKPMNREKLINTIRQFFPN